MSKSRAKRHRTATAAPEAQPAATRRQETILGGLPEWFRSRLLRLPRLVRILIAFVLAVALTGAIFPVVDAIYIQHFFTVESRIVPSYVSTFIGLLFYLMGWYLIVGPSGENKVSAHPLLAWYCVVGIAAFCLDVVLIMQGFSMTEAISG